MTGIFDSVKNLASEFSLDVYDIELLLAHALNIPPNYLYAQRINTLDSLLPEQKNILKKNLERRKKGEPIAYILGAQGFWSLDLEVNSHTLIPRPCTELLVELVLKYLPKNFPCQVLDLGTGSGAIILALARERPHWKPTGSDNYPDTLEIAKKNAKNHGLFQINFVLSNWCEKFFLSDLKLDAIVSNPPYIKIGDIHLEQGDLRFEPKQALVSGEDGLTALKIIIRQSRDLLKPGGYLFLEHGFDQGEMVRNLMQAAGYINIQQYRDLEAHERVVTGQLQIR